MFLGSLGDEGCLHMSTKQINLDVIPYVCLIVCVWVYELGAGDEFGADSCTISKSFTFKRLLRLSEGQFISLKVRLSSLGSSETLSRTMQSPLSWRVALPVGQPQACMQFEVPYKASHFGSRTMRFWALINIMICLRSFSCGGPMGGPVLRGPADPPAWPLVRRGDCSRTRYGVGTETVVKCIAHR